MFYLNYCGAKDGSLGRMFACGETRFVDYGFELELEFHYFVLDNYDVSLRLRIDIS